MNFWCHRTRGSTTPTIRVQFNIMITQCMHSGVLLPPQTVSSLPLMSRKDPSQFFILPDLSVTMNPDPDFSWQRELITSISAELKLMKCTHFEEVVCRTNGFNKTFMFFNSENVVLPLVAFCPDGVTIKFPASAEERASLVGNDKGGCFVNKKVKRTDLVKPIVVGILNNVLEIVTSGPKNPAFRLFQPFWSSRGESLTPVVCAPGVSPVSGASPRGASASSKRCIHTLHPLTTVPMCEGCKTSFMKCSKCPHIECGCGSESAPVTVDPRPIAHVAVEPDSVPVVVVATTPIARRRVPKAKSPSDKRSHHAHGKSSKTRAPSVGALAHLVSHDPAARGVQALFGLALPKPVVPPRSKPKRAATAVPHASATGTLVSSTTAAAAVAVAPSPSATGALVSPATATAIVAEPPSASAAGVPASSATALSSPAMTSGRKRGDDSDGGSMKDVDGVVEPDRDPSDGGSMKDVDGVVEPDRDPSDGGSIGGQVSSDDDSKSSRSAFSVCSNARLATDSLRGASDDDADAVVGEKSPPPHPDLSKLPAGLDPHALNTDAEQLSLYEEAYPHLDTFRDLPSNELMASYALARPSHTVPAKQAFLKHVMRPMVFTPDRGLWDRINELVMKFDYGDKANAPGVTWVRTNAHKLKPAWKECGSDLFKAFCATRGVGADINKDGHECSECKQITVLRYTDLRNLHGHFDRAANRHWSYTIILCMFEVAGLRWLLDFPSFGPDGLMHLEVGSAFGFCNTHYGAPQSTSELQNFYSYHALRAPTGSSTMPAADAKLGYRTVVVFQYFPMAKPPVKKWKDLPYQPLKYIANQIADTAHVDDVKNLEGFFDWFVRYPTEKSFMITLETHDGQSSLRYIYFQKILSPFFGTVVAPLDYHVFIPDVESFRGRLFAVKSTESGGSPTGSRAGAGAGSTSAASPTGSRRRGRGSVNGRSKGQASGRGVSGQKRAAADDNDVHDSDTSDIRAMHSAFRASARADRAAKLGRVSVDAKNKAPTASAAATQAQAALRRATKTERESAAFVSSAYDTKLASLERAMAGSNDSAEMIRLQSQVEVLRKAVESEKDFNARYAGNAAMVQASALESYAAHKAEHAVSLKTALDANAAAAAAHLADVSRLQVKLAEAAAANAELRMKDQAAANKMLCDEKDAKSTALVAAAASTLTEVKTLHAERAKDSKAYIAITMGNSGLASRVAMPEGFEASHLLGTPSSAAFVPWSSSAFARPRGRGGSASSSGRGRDGEWRRDFEDGRSAAAAPSAYAHCWGRDGERTRGEDAAHDDEDAGYEDWGRGRQRRCARDRQPAHDDEDAGDDCEHDDSEPKRRRKVVGAASASAFAASAGAASAGALPSTRPATRRRIAMDVQTFTATGTLSSSPPARPSPSPASVPLRRRQPRR